MGKDNGKEKSSAYNDYFKDGVPDWNEREEEFNEDLDDSSIEIRGNKLPAKKNIPVNDDFTSGIKINKDKLDRNNLNIDERESLANGTKNVNVSDPTKKSVGATDLNINTMDRSDILDD